jgi:PhnB protein
MDINPYIFFNGNCREAFEFYAEVLGGEIEAMVPHAGTPAAGNVDADWQAKILHARLKLGDRALMASDAPPQYAASKPAGFYVQIELPEREDAERVFKALSEGGTVRLPFEKTFFARGFGMLVDRFDIPWMISCT